MSKKKYKATMISPNRAAQLLVAAYGEQLNISEANGRDTFTAGQLDRLKHLAADDSTLSDAVHILQGEMRRQKDVVQTAITLFNLRRPRR